LLFCLFNVVFFWFFFPVDPQTNIFVIILL
jgi:hypothetical protein